MIYHEHALPSAAQKVAFCAWRFALEPGDPETIVHSIPPDGTGNLLIALGPDGSVGRRFVGPSIAGHSMMVHSGWSFAGLRLRPECVFAVTGKEPAAFVGTSDDIHGLDPVFETLGRLAASGKDWAFGAEAAAALGACGGGDPIVAEIVDHLVASGGTASIAAATAAAAGLSPRQLRRRFSAATGLSPKQYASVQRVRRALILSLDGDNWAAVAANAGYSDQPHLNRAIRTVFDAAPRTIGGYIGGIRHIFLEPPYGRFIQGKPRPQL